MAAGLSAPLAGEALTSACSAQARGRFEGRLWSPRQRQNFGLGVHDELGADLRQPAARRQGCDERWSPGASRAVAVSPVANPGCANRKQESMFVPAISELRSRRSWSLTRLRLAARWSRVSVPRTPGVAASDSCWRPQSSLFATSRGTRSTPTLSTAASRSLSSRGRTTARRWRRASTLRSRPSAVQGTDGSGMT